MPLQLAAEHCSVAPSAALPLATLPVLCRDTASVTQVGLALAHGPVGLLFCRCASSVLRPCFLYCTA